jgi:hypothetical protein
MKDWIRQWWRGQVEQAAREPLGASPFKSERVRPVFRILAWLFLAFAVPLFAWASYPVVMGHEPLPTALADWVAIGICIYMLIAFARAAITGRAPTSWLPWK